MRPRTKNIQTNYSTDIDFAAIIENISKKKDNSSVENKNIRHFLKTLTECWNSLTREEQQMLLADISHKTVSKKKRTMLTEEMLAAPAEERKKWQELIEHEKRFKRMKEIFWTCVEKPKRPKNDIFLYSEDMLIAPYRAKTRWKTLSMKEKEVYREQSARLRMEYFLKLQDWETTMRNQGYSMFCIGNANSDVDRYKALLDFFAKDNNIELLERENDKNAVRHWKISKKKDLYLAIKDGRFAFPEDVHK